ncbi:MAG TPA: hypothetical protein VKY53_02105 [Marinobacter sp.]|nr:hypothetical protein [Marinobacter sp.]
MINTEAERQFYLGVAGIRMWYARQPLPGAAPSPDFDFAADDEPPLPEVAVAPAAEAAVRAAGPGKASRNREKIAQLQSLMDTGGGSRASAPVPAEAPPALPVAEEPVEPALAAREETTGLEVPRLNLCIWRSKRVVMICDLSEDTSLALQDTLARNILRSLGEEAAGQTAALRWPLFNNLKVGLNAPENLMATLRDQLADVSAQKLLVLGSCGPWVSRALAREPDLMLETSLAALATDPAGKRQLWQQIRAWRR